MNIFLFPVDFRTLSKFKFRMSEIGLILFLPSHSTSLKNSPEPQGFSCPVSSCRATLLALWNHLCPSSSLSQWVGWCLPICFLNLPLLFIFCCSRSAPHPAFSLECGSNFLSHRHSLVSILTPPSPAFPSPRPIQIPDSPDSNSKP